MANKDVYIILISELSNNLNIIPLKYLTIKLATLNYSSEVISSNS